MFFNEKVFTENFVGKSYFFLIYTELKFSLWCFYISLKIGMLWFVCPGSSTPRDEKPKTGETIHNMEAHLHASRVSHIASLPTLNLFYHRRIFSYSTSASNFYFFGSFLTPFAMVMHKSCL